MPPTAARRRAACLVRVRLRVRVRVRLRVRVRVMLMPRINTHTIHCGHHEPFIEPTQDLPYKEIINNSPGDEPFIEPTQDLVIPHFKISSR